LNPSHLEYLWCPDCSGDLRLAAAESGAVITEGVLECAACDARFPIVRGVPRFVANDNYARSFGLQWNRHSRTQFDSQSGIHLSEIRIFEEARVPRNLIGRLIIEAGSGSGRFTEQLLRTGATVLSFDYSNAVDANYESNAHPNLLLFQADILRSPIRHGLADYAICLGVIQHTSDPRTALLALPKLLRPGGIAIADIYVKSPRRLLGPKYLLRFLTRSRDPERLYRWVVRYVDFMWPLAAVIRRVPQGASLNWRLLVADYSNVGVPDSVLKEWAYLNTFDMLAPRYDKPQTKRTVRRWLTEARIQADVSDGLNGVAVRIRRPEMPSLGFDR
jgi:SAM-dependent methyltransferase